MEQGAVGGAAAAPPLPPGKPPISLHNNPDQGPILFNPDILAHAAPAGCRPEITLRPPTPPKKPFRNFDPTPMLVPVSLPPTSRQHQPQQAVTPPRPDAASAGFDPFSPAPPQRQPVQVSTVTEAAQRSSTLISDPNTGVQQVINQAQQSFTVQNGTSYDNQSRQIAPTPFVQNSTNVMYPPDIILKILILMFPRLRSKTGPGPRTCTSRKAGTTMWTGWKLPAYLHRSHKPLRLLPKTPRWKKKQRQTSQLLPLVVSPSLDRRLEIQPHLQPGS